MEELLNKLLKRGWKPFGWDDKLSSLHKEYGVGKWYIRFHNGMDSELFDLRQLTSKESGLWQFVCENKLVETDDDYSREKYRYNHGMKKEYKSRVIKGEARKYQVDYEYRIIESALCDEEDLDKFLLDNINVGNEQL